MDKIKPLDNIYKLNNTKKITFNIYFQIALLLIIVLKSINYWQMGMPPFTKYLILVFSAVATSILTEIFFYKKFREKTYKEILEIIRNSSPQICGLAISAVMNFGYSVSSIVICTFLGLFIARLLLGEFKNNIFNSVAFTFVLLYSGYRQMLKEPMMSGYLDMFLLDKFNDTTHYTVEAVSNLSTNYTMHVFSTYNPSYLILGVLFLPILIALHKLKAVNFSIAISSLVFLFIMTYSYMGFLNGTIEIDSSNFENFQSINFLNLTLDYSDTLGHYLKSIILYIQVLMAPTFLGLLVVSVDPYTVSKNSVVNMINSFIISFVTFYTKLFTDNLYGVFFGIILANSITPMLEEKIKYSRTKYDISIMIIVILSLIVGFLAFWTSIKGVI